MKKSIVWSGLAAAVVTLASGSAFSGGVLTTPAQLVSFERSTGELWAMPSSQPLTPYLNQTFTEYVAADLISFEPPDPCAPPARVWNFVVGYDRVTGAKSTFVYELLLGTMAELGCRATVTSLNGGTPQPLVAIQPTK